MVDFKCLIFQHFLSRKQAERMKERQGGANQSECWVSLGSLAGKSKNFDLGTIKFWVFFGRLAPEKGR